MAKKTMTKKTIGQYNNVFKVFITYIFAFSDPYQNCVGRQFQRYCDL